MKNYKGVPIFLYFGIAAGAGAGAGAAAGGSAAGAAGGGAAAGAAIGAATQVGMLGLGFIGLKRREERADKRQKELMDIQNQNQRALNEQGQQLAMKTWNETNYEAQMEHMKKAGLNPALMYGKGGGGGTTAAGSGGSAAGGQAQQGQYIQQQNNMKMGIELMEAQSRIKLQNSQSNKNDAESIKIEAEGTKTYLDNALTRYLRSDRNNEEVFVEKHEQYGEGTIHDASLTKSVNESEALRADQQIKNMEAEEQKAIVQRVESMVNAELGAAKKSLTEEQTRKIYHDIIVNYINAGLKGLDTIVKGRLASIGAAGKKGK